MNSEQSTQTELQWFNNWKSKYTAQNPPPSIRRADGLGWQFWLTLAWAVSAAVLAATRTMNAFYQAEIMSGMAELWAKFSSANVIFALEGGITIVSALRAAENKKVSSRALVWSIFLIVVISMIAGIHSSLGIIPNINPTLLDNINYLLVIVMGVGASLVAWASGESVGMQIARVLSSRETVKAKHEQDMKAYNDEMLRRWASSDEYRIVRSGVRAEGVRARAAVQEVTDSVRSFDDDRTNTERTRSLKNAGSNEQRDRIVEYLVAVFNSDGRVPGPTEISKQCSTSKSYAHQVRSEWMQENSQSL